MISWQRLFYLLCLAVVEATPAALPLVLLGVPGAWGLLILVVLAGALADGLTAAWLPVERQQPALLGAAFVVAAWAIKIVVGGGAGPLSGWGAAFDALFSPTNARGGLAYLTLLIGLYAFRRGTRLLEHDSISLRRLFARASVGLLAILGFVSIATLRPNDARLTLTTVMLLAFFAIGLLAIALAAAAEEHDTHLRRLGWRGMLTLTGAIGLVLALGLLFAALFGQDAARGVRAIAQGLILVIVLMLLPFLLLLEGLVEQIARMVDLRGLLRILQENQLRQQQTEAQAAGMLSIFPPWVQAALRITPPTGPPGG